MTGVEECHDDKQWRVVSVLRGCLKGIDKNRQSGIQSEKKERGRKRQRKSGILVAITTRLFSASVTPSRSYYRCFFSSEFLRTLNNRIKILVFNMLMRSSRISTTLWFVFSSGEYLRPRETIVRNDDRIERMRRNFKDFVNFEKN